jgi:hypothetical protein
MSSTDTTATASDRRNASKAKPESVKAEPTAPTSAPVSPVQAPAPQLDTSTQETSGEPQKEGKARGAIPTMPICVLWRDLATKKVTAAIVHPAGGDYRVTARGIGGATGSLHDEGYPIGAVRVDGPKWVESRIPEGVEVLGFANIQGFPLPPPE